MHTLIDQIHSIPSLNEGIDIVLLSCNTFEQGAYWEKRLKAKRGLVIGPHTEVISVKEEWPAGNGLGTLLTFQKADQKHSLCKKLEDGASIAMFHMAGKGTRLAPLTLAEYNNKPAVLLPAVHPKKEEPLSILEMVIMQTQILAKAHKGRLLVMWSDQLFLPSQKVTSPTRAVEIFAKKIPPPTKKIWNDQNLSQYGLILEGSKLINKVDFSTYQTYQEEASHLSLGSFSLSLKLLNQLTSQFSHYKTPLDTDPHFWIPMTKDKETRKLFGVQDIGENAQWWDFGTVNNYYHNVMKLLDNTIEGSQMRHLFGITEKHLHKDSIVINSQIENCHLQRSILVGVEAQKSQIQHTISINSKLHSLEANKALLYNVSEKERPLVLDGSIRADLYQPKHLKYLCPLNKGALDTWNEKLKNNPLSFKEQYDTNSLST